ncbi:site-specific tyrosine recombinase XerD [Sanguibacter hominis ATCC BAA-789]|uniref:Tyrosine recombinase XerD n=1 Tax=Sanguibacter hominis ATCC BAA-789 TaxID=1312740 RepID=A0A9X5FDZ2_9MICO|nr:site-specific tyrosine recombinase XerD [Sanguibacter hominis]NKX93417.1 site-specific tyrosine recombinase XerD [Sanguibacter hominis ATCC BAA-789]
MTDADAPVTGGDAAVEVPSGLDRTVRQYLAHLRVERGLSPNTLDAYRRDLERHVAFLASRGVQTPDSVAPEDLEAYVAAVRTGDDGGTTLSASSTARSIAAVRGWLRFCELEGTVRVNPATALRPPAQPRRLPKAISVEDVTRIIEAAGTGDGPVPLRDRALLELVYSTGARISEAVGLTVDDLDLTRGAASVRLFGKGRKERIVPLGSYACDAIEAYLVRARPALASAGRGVPTVFLNTRGNPLSRQSAWAVLRSASERSGIESPERVSPHTLRHSFATHLLQGGADVRVVQELLGHASVTTTQIYTLVTPDALREMYVAAHPRALGRR